MGGLNKAVGSLNYSQDFIAKTNSDNKGVKVYRKYENGRIKTFIASETDFEEYLSNPRSKGMEPIYWNQERHCGSTFVRREHYDAVGGYCEDFVSWGCWDADFQWKIGEKYEMHLVPHGSDFEVIHMDHPKGYFSSEKWTHDKNIQKSRRNNGVESCIINDLNEQKYKKRQVNKLL